MVEKSAIGSFSAHREVLAAEVGEWHEMKRTVDEAVSLVKL